MKGLSFVSFALLCMVAGGVERLGQLRRPVLRVWPVAGAAAALLVLVVGRYRWQLASISCAAIPIVYGARRSGAAGAAQALPEGAPVLIVGDGVLRGPNAALLATRCASTRSLGPRDDRLYTLQPAGQGRTAPYGVFSPDADPDRLGLRSRPLWRSNVAVLYAAPAQRLAHLNGRLGRLHRRAAEGAAAHVRSAARAARTTAPTVAARAVGRWP